VLASLGRADTNWLQKAKFTASDGNAGDILGYSVSISDDYATIGAHGDNDSRGISGSAYIFKEVVCPTADLSGESIAAYFFAKKHLHKISFWLLLLCESWTCSTVIED
jgi:hypothetical protein